MLGSIYIGLSGLIAYSKGLQTISNNVTNLNTSGFKATSFSFGDAFTDGGLGGTHSRYVGSAQIGAGVRYGGEAINFRQGDLRDTGNDLDLGIEGTGMLVLLNGDRTYYTRTSQFGIDEDGFIAQLGSGYQLGVLNSAGQAVGINIDSMRTSPPVATTTVKFTDNLSADLSSPTGDPSVTVSDIVVYDSLGGRHVWNAKFTPVGASAPGEWTVEVTENGTAVGTPQTLKFTDGAPDPTTTHLTFSKAAAGGAAALSVDLDFSAGVTSYSTGTVSNLHTSSVDGSALGSLQSVTIDEEGRVKLTYSNKKTETLGAVAIADFRDPQALSRLGTALFENRSESDVRFLASGQDGVGKLKPGSIEASNVDLSAQFGDLILVQRGFQAASQVVSISNDMIQQLFGIQGRG